MISCLLFTGLALGGSLIHYDDDDDDDDDFDDEDDSYDVFSSSERA